MYPEYKYSINELNQMAYDYRHGQGSFQQQNNTLYTFLQNATYNGGNSRHFSSQNSLSSNNFYDNKGYYTSSRLM